jgi:2-methylisocitrate lyase-like PEP mutase family enzyme
MPNPWDAGTARLLADLGFEAIATSSAALAWTMARPDAVGAVRRDHAIAHARLLHEASALPVNGDFESGYGETPAEVAETIRRAIDAGVGGCSIEDQDQTAGGLYPMEEALRRFSAAKEAALRSGSDFVLTGRCEVFFHKHPDPLGEAVRRLRLYESAGADVVYAPGVTQEREVAEIVSAVSVPVNVIGGLGGVSNDLAALERLGVRRVSIGSGLAKVALGAFLKAAQALADRRFAYEGAATSSTLNGAFSRPREENGDA